jgi:hypothetical protein
MNNLETEGFVAVAPVPGLSAKQEITGTASATFPE